MTTPDASAPSAAAPPLFAGEAGAAARTPELSGFRRDINGLRAWAVVFVILYHFSTPGFGGGFIGVDVFFVISGFLMTGIVVKNLERGCFSLIDFYLARARRIVPALLGLCAVLLALGFFFLSPPDYKTLGTHTIGSLGFFSNFKYWDEAGYFDVASHEKWLLHTWSLSVEWQFYLLLPIVLWLTWRIRPGRATQIGVVLAGIALTLGWSLLSTGRSPTAAFFLLHTRAWEMLCGGLVFLLGAAIRPGEAGGRWLEALGMAAILAAAMLFDPDSPWPGWRATIPVVGTMLVLTSNRASPWTGHRAAQWLGERSYSLYLWHWPVFVGLSFAQLQHDAIALAGGLLLTGLLGDLSCRWLEIPGRRLLGGLGAPSALMLLAAAGGAVLAPALAIRLKDGVGGRFPPLVELAAAETNNFNHRRTDCHTKRGSQSLSCIYGGKTRKLIAVGDSHVSALVSGIAAARKNDDDGVVQWSYSGCPFVPGIKQRPRKLAKLDKSYQCGAFIEWAQRELDAIPPDIPIVIINRYAQGAWGPNEEHAAVEAPEVYFSKEYAATTPELLAEFGRHITDTACRLAQRRTVYMLRPIPEMGFDVPKTLSRRLALGISDDVSIPYTDYQRRNGWVLAAQDAAHEQCGVRILDPLPYLCRDGRCYGSQKGHPIYVDDDHLSEFGNKLLVPVFRRIFDELEGS